MTECEAQVGAFQGWKVAECDALIHDLRKIIIDLRFFGCACAIFPDDWDELIQGDSRKVFGESEHCCVITCMYQALEMARERTTDDTIVFVFDSRPQRSSTYELVHRQYRHMTESGMAGRPIPLGISFLSSAMFTPLQAADLVAWEFYHYAKERKVSGKIADPRAHLGRLVETGRFFLQLVDRGTIEQLSKMKVPSGLGAGNAFPDFPARRT